MADLNNIYRYIAAGFQRLDYHVIDSNGLPAGATGVVPTGATGVGAGRIFLAKTMGITTPNGDVVPITGDNVLAGGFVFPNVQPRSFQIVFAEDDFADRKAMQNIIKRDIGNFTFAGRDVLPFNLNNVMMIGVSNASARGSGVQGLGMYAGIFATRTQMTVQGRDSFSERGAAGFQGTVVVNPMDSYPWGETFKNSVEGYEESFVEDWTSRLPPTVHRWKTLSSVSKVYLAEPLASTDVDDCLFYTIDANGETALVTAGVTLNTTDNSINFSSPLTATNAVAWYMHN